MKYLALLFLFGFAAASSSEWLWESGKEHVFEYSGRLLSGLPELASHYSGLGINCTVLVQVRDPNTLLLSVRSPKFVRVNERLEPTEWSIDSTEGSNWRELRWPESQMSPVSSEYVTILEKPILFSIYNGEIRSAKVSKDEPEWSVNFKKALALLFQTKLDTSSSSLEQNRLEVLSGEGESYWRVKEETIDGVCENVYQVNELPRYMIKDRPEMIPYPEICSGNKYYEVTKTRDVDTCEKKSTFTYFKPGRMSSGNGENSLEQFSRSSVTRYIACGSRGRLVIQTIINDGELSQNLMGYKTERFLTGTFQILRLKEIRSSSTPMPTPSETVTLKSMMYEYSYKNYRHSLSSSLNSLSQEEKVKLMKEGRIPKSLVETDSETVARSLPRNFLTGLTPEETRREMSPSHIKSQLKTLLKEIVHELRVSTESRSSEKEIAMKVLSLARGFSMLTSKTEIRSLYESLKSELSSSHEDVYTMKNIFFDTVLMSGTPESIYFIKDMILSGEVSEFQTISLLVWMPHYVIAPTKEVLKSIYELVSSDHIRSRHLIYSPAIMSFSTLLEKACLSPERKSTYPTQVFGKFCSPESEIITEKWIPHLVHDLKYSTSVERKTEILVSLGILKSKVVIGELIPYVEGTVSHSTPFNRLMALYSLSSVGEKEPTTVLPVLFSVLSNPAETSEIRIAAFNGILRLNPSMSMMHKIAALTWTDTDMEVIKVINTAFFTLTKELESGTPEIKLPVSTLPRKASLVYPLIKKVPGMIPTSGIIYTSDNLKSLGVGYNSMLAWTASNTSFVPNSVFTEMKYFLDRYNFRPISLGLRLENAENLYTKIGEILTPMPEGVSHSQEKEERIRKVQSELNSEWVKIIKKLNLKTRESGPMSGGIFMSLMESTPLMYNFDKVSSEMLRSKISPYLKEPHLIKKHLCGRTPVNFQRAMDVSPSEFLIPSDMGFPIIVETHTPITLSLRGEMNVDCSLTLPSVSLKTKAVYTSQYTGWVGTISPFTKEYLVTGIDEKSVVNVPAEISMKLNILNSKVSVNLKTLSTQSSPVDIFHFHVHPFTVVKKITDLRPITSSSTMKLIKSKESLKEKTYKFGETLGLEFSSKIKTESRYVDLRSVLETLKMYNSNPLNILRFPWVPSAKSEYITPSVRRSEYTLSLNPSGSSTKEIEFDLKIGYGSKVKGQSIKYHSLKVKPQSSSLVQESVVPSMSLKPLKKLLPVEVESQPIESSVHPRRQEKIKKMLEELSVESGHGISIIYSTILRGSRTSTSTYQLTVVSGEESPSSSISGYLKHRWNIHLDSDVSSSGSSIVSSLYPWLSKICIKGEVEVPLLPIWNLNEIRTSPVNFRYHNVFSFGRSSCSESTIHVHGSTKVSEKQKEYSRISSEAKKCKKLMEEGVAGAKFSLPCERTRLQSKTLDEVEFKIDFVSVPSQVKRIEWMINESLKSLLWAHVRRVSEPRIPVPVSIESDVSGSSSSSGSLKYRLEFHRETPSFDMTVERTYTGEIIKFTSVRIPYPLNLLVPMKANENNPYLMVEGLTGRSLSPMCKIDTLSMTTFDNKTIPFHIDYCYHLLAADCTSNHRFGVLTRTMKPGNRREVKVVLGDVSLVITPERKERSSPYFPGIKATIEEEEINIPVNMWKPVTRRGKTYGEIFRSTDNVIHFKSPSYFIDLVFDGEHITLQSSQMMKGKLCGLCGNFNHQKREDLTGPSKCIYSKPELQIASYRVPSSLCEPLPSTIESKLRSETQQCAKFKVIPTKISKSLKTQTGRCTVLKHAVITTGSKICISKVGVTECGPSCKVESGKLIKKSVDFVCLPEGRLAEHYKHKALNGEDLPELRSMTTSFKSEVEQPRRCVSTMERL